MDSLGSQENNLLFSIFLFLFFKYNETAKGQGYDQKVLFETVLMAVISIDNN